MTNQPIRSLWVGYVVDTTDARCNRFYKIRPIEIVGVICAPWEEIDFKYSIIFGLFIILFW